VATLRLFGGLWRSRTAPPTVTAASVNAAGTVLTLTFNKAMANPAGKHAQFAANDGSARTFSAAALNADTTKIDLTISGSAIYIGATVTASYTVGTVVAGDGGVLATFSGQAVTNNSTVSSVTTSAVADAGVGYASAVEESAPSATAGDAATDGTVTVSDG